MEVYTVPGLEAVGHVTPLQKNKMSTTADCTAFSDD